MPLKNYTSSVSAHKSIQFIERQLAAHGATSVMKRYGPEGRIEAIMFVIPIDGKEMVFKVPSRIKACEKVLESMLSPRARPETVKKIPAQAERTAWKINSDWIEAQMAMIDLAQVELIEVFLPYAYDPATQRTFFEQLKERKYKGLLE
jgi:hypothetical protein